LSFFFSLSQPLPALALALFFIRMHNFTQYSQIMITPPAKHNVPVVQKGASEKVHPQSDGISLKQLLIAKK
jgi:hypothetical protein